MEWIALILGLISIILVVRLFLLKKSMRQLIHDYKCSSENVDAEQHVNVTFADRELESLALELNHYIEKHFQQISACQMENKQIRNEITNLSHDLRTPLTSILGYLDLIEDDNLEDDQKEYLSIIKRRGNNLNELINELYDYVRLQNNDFVVKNEKQDLYLLVQEHLLEYYDEFLRNNIKMQVDLGNENQPVWILADLKSIQRVLVNLTSNSIKYSGGSLKVSLLHTSDGEKLIFRTLRGDLTDLDIDKLFDRFYRKDENRSDVIGSGLGLTVARILMERMNGSIAATSDMDYLYITCTFQQYHDR